jgi:hypothetical protein
LEDICAAFLFNAHSDKTAVLAALKHNGYSTLSERATRAGPAKETPPAADHHGGGASRQTATLIRKARPYARQPAPARAQQ